MLFTFLISIVFIAEVIITFAILILLNKLDNKILYINSVVSEAKPLLKETSDLAKKISGQMVELAEDFEFDVQKKEEDAAIKLLNKTLIALILWKMNSKYIRRLQRSKFMKTAVRGFNLLKNMV